MKRLPVAMGAILALSVVVSTANADSNAANAHKCQQGGYVNYSTTAGKTFKNAGDCVSHAAQGGSLVSLPDLVLGVSCISGPQFAACDLTVTNQGIGAATGTVQLNGTLHSTSPLGFVVADPFAFPGCTSPGFSGFVNQSDAAAGVSCTGTFPPGTTVVPFIVSISGQVAPAGTAITITGAVDPANLVLESNESNNTFSQTFTLS